MGELSDPKKVKLFISIIYRPEVSLEDVFARLKRKFGSIEEEELALSFNYTDYYEKEFGKDLLRLVISFKKLVPLNGIAKIKIFSNKLEDKNVLCGNRTINLDPGYITEAKLVLLTTKDYSHRLYISDKIFAEVTLHFKDGSFRPWPWSYPDYSSDEMVEYFNELRARYIQQLKG